MHCAKTSKLTVRRFLPAVQPSVEHGIASTEDFLGRMIDDSMKDLELVEIKRAEAHKAIKYPRLRRETRKIGTGYLNISAQSGYYPKSSSTQAQQDRCQEPVISMPSPVASYLLPVSELERLWCSQSVTRIETPAADYEEEVKTDAATCGSNTNSPSFSLKSYQAWHPGPYMEAIGSVAHQVDTANTKVGGEREDQGRLWRRPVRPVETYSLYRATREDRRLCSEHLEM